ncbi:MULTISPECIES: hypothetical protein [unclassified Streptomyces]|uniref:hypothetical protein n=1 Tax=unclassified Streptomyces TaxID=2593676 RepID=UPI000D146D38|nr:MULTISPECIES: hypothetical protein [unclassified Streptomyces]
MSYDLAIWQGDNPSSDREAAKEHDRLYEEYLEVDELMPVTDVIADFLEALTERWPDRGVGEETPWAAIPLSEGASGPYVYISLAWGSAEETSAYVAQVASRLGLVCFDPQLRSMRTS